MCVKAANYGIHCENHLESDLLFSALVSLAVPFLKALWLTYGYNLALISKDFPVLFC